MASFPQNQFQQFLLQTPSQQQSKPFRDMYNNNNNNNMDGQISPQLTYYTPDLMNHHPFQVEGLAPGPAQEEPGLDSQWSFGLGPPKKRPKEQIFLEKKNTGNSQICSLDLLQARSVSTGLGLSLDNPLMASSSDSALIGLLGEELDHEFQRQDDEINRYLKVQGDRLRQEILQKFQLNQHQTVSYIEEKVQQKLREKESEIAEINRKNTELESRIEQISFEANSWQQQAKYNENLVNTLRINLQQVYAQSRDSKEGCGDSEIDDTASCCNGGPLDFHLLGNSKKEMAMACKVCGVNRVSMLLLPCKHLCLCKDCESRLSHCPLCQSSKYIGMEVYV